MIFRTCVAALMAMLLAVEASAFETSARGAYVLDMTTGTVLLDKNGDKPLPPASMSKLMTLYVAFEAVRDGRLGLDERLPVSKHAMSYGGSTMFLDTTDRVRVQDLLRGIVVLSGNDACAVIAEALSPDGTEAGFARYMTQRARKLGLTNSVFKNSNGWPAEGHVMSMHDLVVLSKRMIEDFPVFYEMFAEREYRFDGRAPSNIYNRNPLLGLGIGADGLKTGHTQAARYGLTGSARQDERRIVFAISGLDTAAQRAREAEAIISWAFRQFARKTVLRAGEVVSEAPVWMGEAAQVGLTPASDVETLLPMLDSDRLAAEIVHTGPVRAPVAKGAPLAELVLSPEGMPEMRVPLVAAEDVASGGFLTRMRMVATHLLNRMREGPEGAS